AILKSSWKHLPYWESSVWLPLEGGQSKPLIVKIGEWPTLVGTSHGLLGDLREIAEKSDMHLGKKPEHFDLMRSDPNSYYALHVANLDMGTTLQWIWLAYATGAELAISHGKPLWQTS